MGQHEDRSMIRRVFAPPALPAVIRPRTSDGAKHVSPENPGAKAGKAVPRDLVVDAGLAIRLPVHPTPDARVKEPLHHVGTVHAERMLEVLAGASTIAVDRNGEAVDAELRHGSRCSFFEVLVDL